MLTRSLSAGSLRLLPFLTASLIAVLYTAASAQSERVEAKLISAPTLNFPASVTEAGIKGKVRIAVNVDKNGAVEKAEIVSGPMWPCSGNGKEELKLARKLILEKIRAAKFEPRKIGAEATSAELELTYSVKANTTAADVGRLPGAPRMINAGVVNGKAKRLPKPAYPPGARAERASGAVAVEVEVDEKGKVEVAAAISGHPLLLDAARDAACDAVFAPTTLQGNPIRITGVITYAFVP